MNKNQTMTGAGNSAAHTKGPWKFAPIIDHYGYGDDLRIIQEGSGEHPQGELVIARANAFLAAESHKNAQLIASAPELLFALKVAAEALEAYSGGDSSDLPAIYQAIARAEGRNPQLANDWDEANEDYHA